MTKSYYKKAIKNTLDKNFNKYITYYFLIGTPIILYIISTHHQWLTSSSSLSYLIFYLTLISIFTLITDTFNMRYNILTRFITSIIILLTSILMIIIIMTPISLSSYFLIFLFLLCSIITTSIFELSTILLRTLSKEYIIDMFQSIYNSLNIIINEIIDNKMLFIMIFIFITPLIPLHGTSFGTGGLTLHADANVTINQYSYYNSSDYNVVVEINDLENSDYLIVKEQEEKSETTITECPNSELNNVDYLPTNEELQLRSNESGSVSSDVHSKYASILTTECQFAIVKGLNINDKIQVYGGVDGSEYLISEYTVQSIK